MESFLSNILPFLALLLGFGFLIFVHELGHFLVAKWVGIRCTQFAIGFGHSVLSWRKGLGIRAGTTEPEYERRARRLLRDEGVDVDNLGEMQQQLRIYEAGDRLGLGETEYRLNWMPLGGYVKMLGQEDMDPTARSDDPRAFNRKPVWARAAVISAGVTMNLIFGLIFFVIAFMAGVKIPPAIVGDTVPDAPAATVYALGHDGDPQFMGLQPGDHVLSINGEQTTDFMDIAVGTALASADDKLTLVVKRDGHPQPLTYEMVPVQADSGSGRLLSIGVRQAISLTLGKPMKASKPVPALDKAGVGPGYRLTKVDGQDTQRYDQFAKAIEARAGKSVKVTFVNDKTGDVRHVEIEAVPLLVNGKALAPNLLGLMPVMEVLAPMTGSRAMSAGLTGGDVLVEIDGVPYPDLQRGIEAVGSAANRPIKLVVMRGDEMVTLGPVAPDEKGKLGFLPGNAAHLPLVGGALPNTPGAQLELNPGSRITAINGHTVADWGDIQRTMADAVKAQPEGGTISVTFVRHIAGNPEASGELTYTADDAKAILAAGWEQPITTFEDLRVPIVAATPWAATKMGVHKTKQFMLQTYVTLLRLFQRTVPHSELRGPVGIFHIGTQTAQQGWTYLMFFLGLISVNLVVINFLPIPIVDGGLMVFLLIEKIKGSPVHPKVLAAANWVGLAMIGSVMLMTLYYDILRLVA